MQRSSCTKRPLYQVEKTAQQCLANTERPVLLQNARIRLQPSTIDDDEETNRQNRVRLATAAQMRGLRGHYTGVGDRYTALAEAS